MMAASGRRKGGLILIVVALIMILLLAVVGFFLRDSLLGLAGLGDGQAVTLPSPTPVQDLARIVILAQPASRGTEVNDTMLTTVAYPQSELMSGLFYTDPQAVIGLRVKYDLPQGIPLTPSLLTEQATGSFAAIQIPRGMVAVSIPANRLQLVSYALMAGDHVNIIASLLLLDIDTDFQTRLPNFSASVTAPGPGTANEEGATGPTTAALTIASGGVGSIAGRTELDPVLNQAIYVVPSEAQRPRLISQTVVQDAMVLWVGDFPADGKIDAGQVTPTPPPGDGTETAPAVPPRPDIITVVVSPQDAQTINYLLLSGANLNLALRSAGDDQRIPTEPVTLQFVLDQYGIPYPVKLPYGLEPPVLKLPANIPLTSSSGIPGEQPIQ
ncbi:MAG: hypothetical protein IT308_11385 [Anaerolineaceae bacterium]|nr:hypothetical protein [Anaerolineaceae bacterium]